MTPSQAYWEVYDALILAKRRVGDYSCVTDTEIQKLLKLLKE